MTMKMIPKRKSLCLKKGSLARVARLTRETAYGRTRNCRLRVRLGSAVPFLSLSS